MNKQQTPTELFGPKIFGYSRQQAHEDGFLVCLSSISGEPQKICRQHYKHPISCTLAVWDLIEKAVENQTYNNDLSGILHDILWMSRAAGRLVDESTKIFPVIIKGAGRKSNFELKLVVGPGDLLEPVITIMLSHED